MVRVSDVLDSTAAFLKDHFVTLIPAALIAFWVPTVFAVLLPMIPRIAGLDSAEAFDWLHLPVSLLAFWGVLVIIAYVLELASPAQAALRRLPVAVPALLVLLLPFVLVLCIIGYLFLVLVFGGGFGFGDLEGIIFLVALLLVFPALCFALWLAARLLLVIPAIVAGRGFDAFAYSFTRTPGMALPLIGVALLYIIMCVVASVVVAGLFGLLFRLLGGAELSSLVELPAVAVGTLVQSCFDTVMTVFVAKLYLALSDRPVMGTA